jgi:hypothetical protein
LVPFDYGDILSVSAMKDVVGKIYFAPKKLGDDIPLYKQPSGVTIRCEDCDPPTEYDMNDFDTHVCKDE